MSTVDETVDPARDVQDFANRVHRLSNASGRADLAGQLERESERYRQSETTVVVVGDEKSGKSSLVNALMGEALLPVGIDITTSAYIAIRHGSAIEVSVVFNNDTEPRVVDLERLTEFATVDGNPGNERHVGGIIVSHPHPMLASGLVLVDTPGIGGLDASHGELTLAALRTADVLVFVLDASAPLSQSELQFLERATERIERVVFAVTKIDAFRGWRTIIEENRQLLSRHAPRFANAPMLGVSSKLRANATRMSQAGDEARAEQSLADSRVLELVAMLEDAVQRGGSIKLGNLVRSADNMLTSIEETLTTTLRSATADAAVAKELDDKRAALVRVTESAARWRLDLDAETKRLGFDFDARVDVALARLDQQLQDRINTGKTAILDTIVEEVEAALEAVWVEHGAYLAEEVNAIVDRLTSVLALDGVAITSSELLMPEYLHETADVRRAKAASGDTEDWASKLLQYYPIAFAAMMPVSLAGFVGIAIGGPLAWIIGGGVAGAMVGARRKQARVTKDRRAAMEYARATVADARKVLAKQFAQQLSEVRRLLEEAIGGALNEQRRVLEKQVRENETLARQDAETRARVRQQTEERLREMQSLHSTAASLIERLGTRS
jgi:signal recognition particle receptor subunit beta